MENEVTPKSCLRNHRCEEEVNERVLGFASFVFFLVVGGQARPLLPHNSCAVPKKSTGVDGKSSKSCSSFPPDLSL